ncbi:calcium-translocating P-type ATPase, PMCA-type [Candidatus Soleaferrea massiliensis]|uniref:calcium-translocating P-type ATPase, PMCA-type n=1 Tax=Candidatus Soleaferrea massiliensis TaxID=1470354 RepID=UPI000A8A7C2B|nr:calcium-translocating P-type ATPase, PMCA-type [Candidatus Soleaferrea massiliensis]
MITHKMNPLNEEEVLKSRKEHGSNMLTPPKQTSFLKELWANFRGDALIRILTVALVVTLVFALLGWGDWLEAVGIAIAVVLATTVSTYSEYSNNKLFQKLQDEYSKIICRVFRRKGGQTKISDIKIDEIVVGDYILLQAGDKISADGVIVDGEIKVNQASLNGESEEAEKTAAAQDYAFSPDEVDFLDEHKVYRGSVVTSGEAVMLVKCVGDTSQFGKLAKELGEEDDRESPLKLKLGKLADNISKFGYIGGALIAVAFMINCMFLNPSIAPEATTYFSMANWQEIVMDVVHSVTLAIVIIVVAVPEGLPMMIALVSGLNMKKLLKDNILIRKIDGAETAGSLNILYSDKTGTITKGQLQVVSFYSSEDREYGDYGSIPDKLREMLLISIKGNTNAVCIENSGKLEISGGNVTERALHEFLGVEGERQYIGYNISIKDELMFNSKNKYSASEIEDRALIKGAPEKLLQYCTYYYDEDMQVKPLTAEMKAKIENRINALATKAMRVLAFATSSNQIGDDLLKEMTFIGLVGIRDELRPEAVTAIEMARKAGIQVVMVTGDKKETAFAIARDAGLVQQENDLALTSDELNALSDEQLKEILPKLRVVARALPTDKSRLVRISQELNLVVGMTGDGVNDAPALKKADVGFAMGSGTEVSKEAADITILDDNFNSVVKTVLYGRTIFNNIRKFIVFQLTINVSAVLIAFIGPFLGIGTPLSVTQMLWVNIVMDTLAALALGGEPPLPRYMEEKPKRRDESIINRNMWSSILTVGGYLTAACLVVLLVPFFRTLFRAGPAGNADLYFLTGFFCFYVLSAMLNGLNVRTDKINIFEGITANKGFLSVMALIVVVQVLMTYIGGAILRTAGLNLQEWAVVVLGVIIILPIGTIRKLIFNKRHHES